MAELYEGDKVEVTVGAVAHGGHCVARHEGRVIFVRHALPGERVVTEITEIHKAYLRGDCVEVLAASRGSRILERNEVLVRGIGRQGQGLGLRQRVRRDALQRIRHAADSRPRLCPCDGPLPRPVRVLR